ANLFSSGQLATAVVSANVAALMEGVLKTMLATKLKLATVALLGMALVAGGASLTVLASSANGPTTADQLIRTEGPKAEPGNPSPARTLHLPEEPYRY